MNKKEVIKLKNKIRQRFTDTSDNLFNNAWKEYIRYLNGSIDNPNDEEDIYNWIDNIISEKVNNPKSKYYIYG